MAFAVQTQVVEKAVPSFTSSTCKTLAIPFDKTYFDETWAGKVTRSCTAILHRRHPKRCSELWILVRLYIVVLEAQNLNLLMYCPEVLFKV